MNLKETFEKGIEILGEFLYPIGFEFSYINNGTGSGGEFATGEFKKGHLKLELHFRESVGMVKYHYKSYSVSHNYYMRSLGVKDRCQYPGYSDDPLDGFRHLKNDLVNFGQDFTGGDHEILIQASREEDIESNILDKKWYAKATGENAKRNNAKFYFDAKKYQQCINEMESLQFPELLKESEKKMLEIARRKIKDA